MLPHDALCARDAHFLRFDFACCHFSDTLADYAFAHFAAVDATIFALLRAADAAITQIRATLMILLSMLFFTS